MEILDLICNLQRLDIYKKYADELIEKDKAYYCFCTPERLKTLKEEQEKQKLPQAKYDKHCLHLSKEEIENNLRIWNSKSCKIKCRTKSVQLSLMI